MGRAADDGIGVRAPSMVSMNSLAIETHGLGKRFGARAALESIDLEVPRGSAFGFLGRNGAGKTTLVRLLLGLAQPTSGTMKLLGHELPGGRAEALARVGAIVEEPRFHPHLTGRENLHVHAAARDKAAHGRVDGALERVGLTARADDPVKSYSLGMRQRLGIARCLLCDPELLILDEPVNGLDPAGILEFRHLVRSLVAEGRTVLLSSHLLDEVEKTCDFAAIVDQGRVMAQGTIAELTSLSDERTIDIVAAPTVKATGVLAGVPSVLRAVEHDGGIRATIAPGAPRDLDVVTTLLRRLLAEGISVERVTPVTRSLEDQFLSMTTRLGERADVSPDPMPTVLQAASAAAGWSRSSPGSSSPPSASTSASARSSTRRTDFDSAAGILTLLASVAGAIVGATAGGADIETGVFRDLVATGRSRTALFFARVPAAWIVVARHARRRARRGRDHRPAERRRLRPRRRPGADLRRADRRDLRRPRRADRPQRRRSSASRSPSSSASRRCSPSSRCSATPASRSPPWRSRASTAPRASSRRCPCSAQSGSSSPGPPPRSAAGLYRTRTQEI